MASDMSAARGQWQAVGPGGAFEDFAQGYKPSDLTSVRNDAICCPDNLVKNWGRVEKRQFAKLLVKRLWKREAIYEVEAIGIGKYVPKCRELNVRPEAGLESVNIRVRVISRELNSRDVFAD